MKCDRCNKKGVITGVMLQGRLYCDKCYKEIKK